MGLIYEDGMVKFMDSWKTDNYGKAYVQITDLLPVSTLKKFREFDRRASPFLRPEGIKALRQDLLENGIKNQLMMFYNPANGYANIGEGNHRLMIAEEEGVTHLPVRIVRASYLKPDFTGKRGGAFIKNPKILARTYKKHINSGLKPSDVFDVNDFYDKDQQFMKYVEMIHYSLFKEKKLELANQFLRIFTCGENVVFGFDDFNNELKKHISGLHWLFMDKVKWEYENRRDIYWFKAG